MRILIVDDNPNNRMVLKFFLQDHAKEKQASCDIEEAENGLLALNKVKETKYDLIFMDIMMPVMNGIEATKKIREHDKDVMIIAVSAVEDSLKQKEILRSGAEDYIAKPIHAEQLLARLENYFPLLKLRHHGNLSFHRKAANLYTKSIFKRQTIFYVTSEEALIEFWEYYLVDNVGTKVDDISDVVRAVFSLGEEILKLNVVDPWIIVEEDKDALYFTINRVDVIGEIALKLVMKKNSEVNEYKLDSDKVSFKLEKKITLITDEVSNEKGLEKAVQDIEIKKTDTATYRVFNYMDPEDMDDVEELLGELNTLLLMLGKSTLNTADVEKIANLLENIGGCLTVYTESYVIGRSLTLLSQKISLHINRFQERAQDLSTLSTAFIADLQTWFSMTFYKGAPSDDFMNDTLVTNTQTIIAMLEPEEDSSDEVDMDDIFDF